MRFLVAFLSVFAVAFSLHAGTPNIYILNNAKASNQLGKFEYSYATNTMTLVGSLTIPARFLTGTSEAVSSIGWRDGVLFIHNPNTRLTARMNPATGAVLEEWTITMSATVMDITQSAQIDTSPYFYFSDGGQKLKVGLTAPHTAMYGPLNPWHSSGGSLRGMVDSVYFRSGGTVRWSAYTFQILASHAGVNSRMAGPGKFFFNPDLPSGQMISYNSPGVLTFPGSPAVTVPGDYMSRYMSVFWMSAQYAGARSLDGGEAENSVAKTPVIVSQPWALPALVKQGGTTSLNVSAIDPDKAPRALEYTWSKISGPGAITVTGNGTATANSADATFDTPGRYTVRVTVTDGENATTGDILLQVDPIEDDASEDDEL